MKEVPESSASLRRSQIRRVKRSTPERGQKIHFLHIGKNAGTQVKLISNQINALVGHQVIVKHPHDVFLKDLPLGDAYFFSIRNPVSRFRSGFYSRKRKGRPRFNSEWTPHEQLAFSEFEHANDLAENLFQPGEKGRQATAAMKSISHASQNQSDWFSGHGNFLRVRPPIWIIRQENFEADLRKLISLAFPGFDESVIHISADDVSSHKNDYSNVPALSARAKENLTAWYAQDVEFFDMCSEWIELGGKF